MASEEATPNRDPLSGTPGSHPVGVSVGAAGGAAAGAVIGAVSGPVGTAIGAAIGAVAGGLVGKGVAEVIDPTAEDTYWADHYSASPYVAPGVDYKTYRHAYRFGWESFERHPGRTFDAVAPELQRSWDEHRGDSTLTWEDAKAATRDAWHRVERALPGQTT